MAARQSYILRHHPVTLAAEPVSGDDDDRGGPASDIDLNNAATNDNTVRARNPPMSRTWASVVRDNPTSSGPELMNMMFSDEHGEPMGLNDTLCYVGEEAVLTAVTSIPVVGLFSDGLVGQEVYEEADELKGFLHECRLTIKI
jgi:hypothetical protein